MCGWPSCSGMGRCRGHALQENGGRLDLHLPVLAPVLVVGLSCQAVIQSGVPHNWGQCGGLCTCALFLPFPHANSVSIVLRLNVAHAGDGLAFVCLSIAKRPALRLH